MPRWRGKQQLNETENRAFAELVYIPLKMVATRIVRIDNVCVDWFCDCVVE